MDNGDNTYGGKFVVNPSGGLISKGHPLGATGLAQCAELNWQVWLLSLLQILLNLFVLIFVDVHVIAGVRV